MSCRSKVLVSLVEIEKTRLERAVEAQANSKLFSLPSELLDLIMHYVFEPQKVNLRWKPYVLNKEGHAYTSQTGFYFNPEDRGLYKVEPVFELRRRGRCRYRGILQSCYLLRHLAIDGLGRHSVLSIQIPLFTFDLLTLPQWIRLREHVSGHSRRSGLEMFPFYHPQTVAAHLRTLVVYVEMATLPGFEDLLVDDSDYWPPSFNLEEYERGNFEYDVVSSEESVSSESENEKGEEGEDHGMDEPEEDGMGREDESMNEGEEEDNAEERDNGKDAHEVKDEGKNEVGQDEDEKYDDEMLDSDSDAAKRPLIDPDRTERFFERHVTRWGFKNVHNLILIFCTDSQDFCMPACEIMSQRREDVLRIFDGVHLPAKHLEIQGVFKDMADEIKKRVVLMK
ncbi:hypothetical protein BDY21DRAFT_362723 [Lineolata rhizophorae]|uniref:Uncharacterized protein n=1 Tax=Lineolata rhizophorae TaxID=578093 RepID=A0A6A6P4U3_9PEZI|nr:hypothetical protein BDY21DRAFT_362723 [Lineolata rhizophorae]